MKIFDVFNANKMFYEAIQVWAAVVKQNGAWDNYYMKIMPSYAEAQESKPVIITNNFMVLHESFDINDFQRLFDNLRNGKINVCGFEINLSSTEKISLDREMDRIRSKWALDRFKERYPLYRCAIRSSSSPSVPRNLDVELKSLEEPYSDLQDVLEGLLKIKRDAYYAGSVCVLLPIYLVIRNCSFEEKVLRFFAEFHQKMKDDLDLGFILRDSKGEFQRYSRPIKVDKLDFSDGFYCYEDSELVDEDIVSAEVFLRNKKNPLVSDESDELIRLRPFFELEVFEKFWTEEELERCLKGETGDRGFEWGISTLLTLCGFRVLWTGWGKGRVRLGGADLLAFYEDTLIVAECTIGAIRSEKIDRLLQAVKKVRETLGLEERNTMRKIIPVFFTCSEVSPGTEESAKKSGVKIQDLEDIMKIFNVLRTNRPREEIINLLREPGMPFMT